MRPEQCSFFQTRGNERKWTFKEWTWSYDAQVRDDIRCKRSDTVCDKSTNEIEKIQEKDRKRKVNGHQPERC